MGQSAAASSRLKYGYDVDNFRRFAELRDIPEDIFMRHDVDVAYVTMCWTLHSRKHDAGRTHDNRDPDRPTLPITARTLDVRISGLKNFVGTHGGNADALRSPSLREIIKAFARQDDIVRGPTDSYVRYPLGAEFTWLVIQRIRASMPDRRIQVLYEAATSIEYLFGLRVMEALESTRTAPDPYVLPNVQLPTEDPALRDKEQTAAIHTVRNRDCLLFWRAENIVCAAQQGHRFPPRAPDFITMFSDHSKNWRAGAPPSSVHANPHEEHAAPFCLCAILYEWLAPARTRAAEGFLLAGAHDRVLQQLVKDTATAAQLDPTRATLAGFRRGCASATIMGNDAREAANKLRQQFQNWHSAQGAAPYVEGQLDDGLEKTIQLYDLRSTSITATRTRFHRDAV